MIWLVMVKDKELPGEPDIGLAVIEADDEEHATLSADHILDRLAEQGRARCVARARPVEPGLFYATGAVLRAPAERGPIMVDEIEHALDVGRAEREAAERVTKRAPRR